jgi:hypothetical protein
MTASGAFRPSGVDIEWRLPDGCQIAFLAAMGALITNVNAPSDRVPRLTAMVRNPCASLLRRGLRVDHGET